MAGLLIPNLVARLDKTVQRLHEGAATLGKDGADTGAVGQFYLRSRDLNPRYFQTDTSLPKGLNMEASAKMLNAKHQLKGDRALNVVGDPRLGEAGLQSDNGLEVAPSGSWKGQTENFQQLLRNKFARQAGHSGNTNTWTIDATSAIPGSNEASQFYPAALDYVLAQPDAVKTTSSLTSRNGTRQNQLLAQALEKYPELAKGRILAGPDQFSDVGLSGNYNRVGQFHDKPVDKQIGILNSAGAATAADDVQNIMGRVLDNSRSNGYDNWGTVANDYLSRFKRLGMDVEAPYKPTTDDVNPDDLKELAKIMWGASNDLGFVKPTTGYNGLRRAALTNDAAQGLSPRDLEGINPTQDLNAWTTGLGRARGGSVPRAQENAGALCQCHAHLR